MGILIVAAVAFVVPFCLGLVPALRIPSVVLEIVTGIVIGPAVLGLVAVDEPLRFLALIGLSFLLFLAGMEIDLGRVLHGGALRSAGVGFLLTLVVALGIASMLGAAGLISAPLLVAIMLSATSLGIVVPVLADSGHSRSPLGQLIITGATIADFGAVILLSLFFSGEGGVGSTLLLIGAFVLLVVAIGVALTEVERFGRLTRVLQRLQDSSAQIRVRGALLFLVGFAVLAQLLGLEVILGAFIAGTVLRLVDKDRMMTHPFFRQKLEAVGFGVFIPFFFVVSGIQLDVRALFAGGGAILATVPVFLIALLLVRGLPAILYRPVVGNRGALAAGLLQATSLPFIVATVGIGMELGILSPAIGASLVFAGLLSVVLFPLGALLLLRTETVPSSESSQDASEDHAGPELKPAPHGPSR